MQNATSSQSTIVLFDLNGTSLHCSKTEPVHYDFKLPGGKYVQVHPGIFRTWRELKKEGHDVGIWTSCCHENAMRYKAALESMYRDWHLEEYQIYPSNSLFTYVLTRKHCQKSVALNAKPWDTVKDIRSLFEQDIPGFELRYGNASRVTLVDDGAEKVVQNMARGDHCIVIDTYKGDSHAAFPFECVMNNVRRIFH